jgi:hypothetical protein
MAFLAPWCPFALDISARSLSGRREIVACLRPTNAPFHLRQVSSPEDSNRFSAILLQLLAMRPVHEYNISVGGDTPQVTVL